MPTRDEQILIRVTEDEKSQMEEYVDSDESPFDSVSDLLRGAAQREIHDSYLRDEISEIAEEVGAGIDEENLIDTMEVALSDTNEQLNQLNQRMTEVEEILTTSERITELARELREEWLVEHPADTDPRDVDLITEHGNKKERAQLLGAPAAIAEVHDAGESEIRRALRRAQELYPDVKMVVHDDLPRYYRENPNMSIETDPSEIFDMNEESDSAEFDTPDYTEGDTDE